MERGASPRLFLVKKKKRAENRGASPRLFLVKKKKRAENQPAPPSKRVYNTLGKNLFNVSSEGGFVRRETITNVSMQAINTKTTGMASAIR